MPKKLDEIKAIEKIEQLCKLISTKEETIKFLGWKNNEYLGVDKTYLILYNTKLKITWETTSFANFIKKPTKGPSKFKNLDFLKKRRHSNDEFINKIKEKFPDKNWDFSKTNYINYHTKICIICHEKDPITGKEHGEFWVEPANLLSPKSGDRCPKCSGKYNPTTEEFIEKAKILCNNKYSFEKTIYLNSSTKIIVTCPIHGDFLITPNDFLSGKGCPHCRDSKGEKKIIEFFNKIGISYEYQYRLKSELIKGAPNQKYIFIDFLVKYNNRKIFIEFNGEQHYRYVNIFHKNTDKFQNQYLRDLSIINYARDNGIEYLEIPYCDFERIFEILEAFLQDGIDITTKLTREIWTGPDIPLGLPYYPNIP